jgi:hypothetical protein
MTNFLHYRAISSDEEDDSNALNQNGMGVARARNDNNSNSSSSSDSEDYNDPMEIPLDVQQIRIGLGFQNRLYTSGDSTENKTVLDDKWLTKQGFTINPMKDVKCVICQFPIPDNQMVFDLKCDGTLKHPLHTECAQKYIAKRHTNCPVCRFLWEA